VFITTCLALATNNILISGYAYGSGGSGGNIRQPYVITATWNGTTFTNVQATASTPAKYTGNFATATAGAAILGGAKVDASTMYLCGYYISTSSNGARKSLVIKSTDGGNNWTQETVLTIAVGGVNVDTQLNALCLLGTDIYGVGHSRSGVDSNAAANGVNQVFAVKMTGGTWTQLSTPSPAANAGYSTLTSVASDGTNIFMGGATQNTATAGAVNKAKVLKFTVSGATFSTVTINDPATGAETAPSMASGAASDLWIFGANGPQAFCEHSTNSGLAWTTTTTIAAATLVPSAPAAPTLSLGGLTAVNTPGGPSAVQLKLKGGGAGWSGSVVLAFGASYPRNSANLEANSYIKHVRLAVSVL
jgi:hypothetical protein